MAGKKITGSSKDSIMNKIKLADLSFYSRVFNGLAPENAYFVNQQLSKSFGCG